jgi:hypothetical protein
MLEGPHARATAEALQRLKDVPHCKHCETRVARLKAKIAREAEKAKPTRKPKQHAIPRNEPAQASANAQTAPVTAWPPSTQLPLKAPPPCGVLVCRGPMSNWRSSLASGIRPGLANGPGSAGPGRGILDAAAGHCAPTDRPRAARSSRKLRRAAHSMTSGSGLTDERVGRHPTGISGQLGGSDRPVRYLWSALDAHD